MDGVQINAQVYDIGRYIAVVVCSDAELFYAERLRLLAYRMGCASSAIAVSVSPEGEIIAKVAGTVATEDVATVCLIALKDAGESIYDGQRKIIINGKVSRIRLKNGSVESCARVKYLS